MSWSRKLVAVRYFLLLHLFVFARVKSIEVSEKTSENSFDEEEDQYSAHEETTTVKKQETASQPVNNRKLTSPIVVEDPSSRNSSNVFRPSVHLGEIEQQSTGSRTNPFNNVQHVKFDSNVHLNTRHERFQDTSNQDSISSVLDDATQSSRIKFQEDGVHHTSSIQHPFDQQTVTDNPKSPFEEADLKHVYADQTFFQNAERPEAPDASTNGQSTTDHRLTGNYYDTSKFPYVVSYYTAANSQNGYQPFTHEATYEIKKPAENGVLVLHESTYTRKRKFPYQFYQPSGGYHEFEFVEEPRHTPVVYSQTKKLSPWKKIVHLIGTFLPLGLLLATLTPNIVRIDNAANQSSVILSKLRAVDLPAEHKRSRLLEDQSDTCEDRSICELILAGGEPGSNILQNILWNLAIRISDDVAKRNGLREVFSGVKRKDCMTISC